MATETETADAATAAAAAVAVMGADSPSDQTPLTPPLPPPLPALPLSGRGRDSSIKPERHSLTLDQRRALRSWASAQPTRPSHRACMDWFAYTYGQQISQSTVSHSLSPKYSRLDGDHPPLSGSRLRFGNWPDVEKLVLQWYQGSVAQGRSPTNEELGDKAKAIFAALPRYKGEAPPEFSPGWIHRFKKRYGLLVRRQYRHGSSLLASGPRVPGIPGSASGAVGAAAAAAAAAVAVDDGINPAEDIQYLADSVARYAQAPITPETSPSAVRQDIERVLGLEATLGTCALVRDEILHRQANPAAAAVAAAALARQHGPYPSPDAAAVDNDDDNNVSDPPVDVSLYATTEPPAADSDDPEVVLQNALRAMQEEEEAAEATAAAAREERDRAERIAGHLATPGSARATAAAAIASSASARFTPSSYRDDVHVTPIQASSPTPLPPGHAAERPIRCPFCVNTRMLRSIREAVEHISTHVVV